MAAATTHHQRQQQQQQIHHLPSSPGPDPPPAAADNARPRDRRRAREVSSRYMIITHHPPPSPSNNSSHPPPPPPRKHQLLQQQLTTTPFPRRSSSVERLRPLPPDPLPPPLRLPTGRRPIAFPPPVPPSPDPTDPEDEENNRSDSSSAFAFAFGDENLPLPLDEEDGRRRRTRRRAVSRLFHDDAPAPKPLPLTRKEARLPFTPVPQHHPSSTPRSTTPSLGPRRASSSTLNRSVETPPEKNNNSLGLGGWCESPPISRGGRSARSSNSNNGCRSSADRILAVGEGGSHHRTTPSSSMCNRSLNSALSSLHSPSLNQKVLVDAKKGPGGANRPAEDAHALRLLANHYLQWRFVNARARAVEESRRAAAERLLRGVALRLHDLRDSVAAKCVELQRMKSVESTRNIAEAQMPLLDQWRALETECSDSLSGVTRALQDACLRLPIGGDVKVDVVELEEVLRSAVGVIDALPPRIGALTHQAGDVGELISELATVVSTERDLIGQCGTLLAETQRLQVAECSLRSHLVQMKQQIALHRKGE